MNLRETKRNTGHQSYGSVNRQMRDNLSVPHSKIDVRSVYALQVILEYEILEYEVVRRTYITC